MQMVLPASYAVIEEEEMMYLDGGGFVGVVIHLGAKARKLNGWAAGALASTAVGAKLAPIYAIPKVGWAAAAFISAGVGSAVAWAVSKGIRTVKVGKNIPFVSASINVYTP